MSDNRSLLEKLLDDADRIVHNIVKTQHPTGLLPVFMAVDAKGEPFVVVADFHSSEAKDASVSMLKQVFAEKQIVAYASVAEAWESRMAADHMTGPTSTALPASEAPDRLEVAIISACDNHDAKARVFLIERDDDSRITRLIKHRETDEIPGGRMSDLLKPEAKPE